MIIALSYGKHHGEYHDETANLHHCRKSRTTMKNKMGKDMLSGSTKSLSMILIRTLHLIRSNLGIEDLGNDYGR